MCLEKEESRVTWEDYQMTIETEIRAMQLQPTKFPELMTTARKPESSKNDSWSLRGNMALANTLIPNV